MFKKIYYINLDHRTDRKNNVEVQLKKINYNGPVERVNAAYGKNLDLKLIPKNLFTKGAVDATTSKKDLYNTQTMTKGGMGVSISQKWVFEKILCGEEDYALILEDDITLPEDFMKKLEALLKKVGTFDMLWLGYHVKINKKVFKDYDVPLKIWGLFGYIINKKAAQKLVDMYPITKQIDTEMPKVFAGLNIKALKSCDVLVFSPKSEEATEFGSDIQFSREGFAVDLIKKPLNNKNENILIFTTFLLLIVIISYKYIYEKCIF